VVAVSFYWQTGINHFLRWYVGAGVISALSTTSTITTPSARTTSSKGQDASPGCTRVVKGGCGSLESCVMVLHLVKCGKQMMAGLD
jgi:hypothetical protein